MIDWTDCTLVGGLVSGYDLLCNKPFVCSLCETRSIVADCLKHLSSIIYQSSFIIIYLSIIYHHLSSIIFHLSYIISIIYYYLCHVNVNQDVGCTACSPFQYRHRTWRSNDNDRLIHWCEWCDTKTMTNDYDLSLIWFWARMTENNALDGIDFAELDARADAEVSTGNLQDMLCYQRNPSRVAGRRRS